METAFTIQTISSVVLAASIFIAKNSIEKLIDRYISGLNVKQVHVIFYLFLIFAAVAPFIIGAVIPSQNSNTETNNVTVLPQKTKEDTYVEAGKELINLGKTIADDIKKNDSTIRVNKEKMWVYQIGKSKTDLDDVIMLYEKLKEIPGIYLFEKSKKEFYVIKFDGRSKEELDSSLDGFKSLIEDVSLTVTVTNLMTLCPLRQEIVEGKRGKLKRKYSEIPCFICQ
jgi:hypothetical protein